MIKLGKLLIQVVIIVAVASGVAFAQALQEIRIGSSAILNSSKKKAWMQRSFT